MHRKVINSLRYLLLFAALLQFGGCGTTIGIEIREGLAPSFKPTGTQDASFVAVVGPCPIPPTVSTKENTPYIWMIEPVNSNPTFDDSPLIAYGTIPAGWGQEIPSTGSPPPLNEAAMYCILVVSTRNLSASKCFVVRDGKAINYRHKWCP